MQKYIIKSNDEKKIIRNGKEIILCRICRYDDKNVLGGYIESEDNLSQEGKCWIDENSIVYGGARVEDDALITENSEIYGNDNSGSFIISGNFIMGNSEFININYSGPCTNITSCKKSGPVICGESTIFDSKITGNTTINNCKIFNSEVSGGSKISDSKIKKSKVSGNTVVRDSNLENSTVSGNAQVKKSNLKNSEVSGNAQVKDSSLEKSTVSGNAQIRNSDLEKSTVSGNAQVKKSNLKNLEASGNQCFTNSKEINKGCGNGGTIYFNGNSVFSVGGTMNIGGTSKININGKPIIPGQTGTTNISGGTLNFF